MKMITKINMEEKTFQNSLGRQTYSVSSDRILRREAKFLSARGVAVTKESIDDIVKAHLP